MTCGFKWLAALQFKTKLQKCIRMGITIFLLTVPRQYFFCGSFVLFMSSVFHVFASVHCCLVVTCLERADLFALVSDV